jgi:hypothetical protein
MRSLLPKLTLAIISSAVLVYAVDYGWLRTRMSRDASSAFGTVQVEVIDRIPQKGNKAEYVPEGMQSETCVRSLLPHFSDSPCWYLRRNTLRQVNF